jgi:hypothetical protein
MYIASLSGAQDVIIGSGNRNPEITYLAGKDVGVDKCVRACQMQNWLR